MTRLRYVDGSILYQNPQPHVRSRHAFFPGLLNLPSGDLLALLVIGEAFESADSTTYIARSKDLGKTWKVEGPLYDKTLDVVPTSDYLKATLLRDGSLIAMGYRFHRCDPEQSIGIGETGGILPGDDVVSFSHDQGRTWTPPSVIPRTRPELLEVSGPCLRSSSGDLLALAAMFRMPDGSNPSGTYGVLLRSCDAGRTWSDSETFFEMPGRNITPFEARLCQMDDNRLVAIAWAYDSRAEKSLTNHVVVSYDDGHSWSPAIDTHQTGQAASLLPWSGDYLLVTQAHRTDQVPGIYVRVIDFGGDQWQTIVELPIYGPGASAAAKEDQDTVRMFASLRFGQPSLLRVSESEVLATHWCIEDGLGKIRVHRLAIDL